MMELKDLSAYIDGLDNCRSVMPKIDVLDDDASSKPTYLITHTTEIYEFSTNQEALDKIDQVKTLTGFVGVKRKFVEEKLDKNGEVKQEECYRLTVELDH